MTRHLLAPLEPDTATVGRLHGRLTQEAGRAGLLDLAYTTVETPVGPLLLVASDEGLVRVAYQREDHDAVLQSLADRVSPRILRVPERLEEAATQVEQYFAGTLRRFDVALDLRLANGFRKEVLSHLVQLDYGATASYASVAVAAGSPGAVRAVGTACARNPLPVVIPCHRVLRSDGSVGDYIGGTEAKRVLLELERSA